MGDSKLTPKHAPVRPRRRAKADACPDRSRQDDSQNKGTEDIRNQLATHLGKLRFVNGTISVCVQALQQQAADMDVEIAQVLRRTAGDELDRTADQLEALALGLGYQDV